MYAPFNFLKKINLFMRDMQVSDREDDNDKCASNNVATSAAALCDGVSTAMPRTALHDRQSKFLSYSRGSGNPSASVKFSLGAEADDEDEERPCGPAVAVVARPPSSLSTAAVTVKQTVMCSTKSSEQERLARRESQITQSTLARRSRRADDVDTAIRRVSRQLQHSRPARPR